MAKVLEIPPAFDPSTLVIQPVGPAYALPAVVPTDPSADGPYIDQPSDPSIGFGWQYGDDCSGCGAFAHETNVDAFVLVESFPGRDCSQPGVDGPGGSGQSFVDLLVAQGAQLGQLFPTWLLEDLGLDPATPANFDFWSLACLGFTLVRFPVGPPPPPPPCPPGQAKDAGGVCRPIDPPLPRGVRNLAGPTKALNPTLQSAPTPFAMKDCGCGADDETEVEYDARANPATQIAGLPTNANPRKVGVGIARLSSVGNRAGILAGADSLPGSGGRRGWRQPVGAPTPHTNS